MEINSQVLMTDLGPFLIREIVFKEHIEHAFNIGRIKEVDNF